MIDASAERPDPSLHIVLRVHFQDQLVRSTCHLEAVLRPTPWDARECANTCHILQRENERRQEQPSSQPVAARIAQSAFAVVDAHKAFCPANLLTSMSDAVGCAMPLL